MASISLQGRPRRRAHREPTRLSLSLFEVKAAVFRLRRSALEIGRAPPRLARADGARAFEVVVAQSVTPLWSDPSLAEQAMQLGKVQNLRRAAAALDGLVLTPGAVFSFWRHVGRATRRRGFASGRMLREGCLMPAVGGGLCQLSNALYEVALQAGCEIVERHAHSHLVPGSAAAVGRDATVAWNYVDLRFAAPAPLRLSVRLCARDLTVRLLGETPLARATIETGAGEAEAPAEFPGAAESCGSCDRTDCLLHEHGARARTAVVGRKAFVVDEAWPEFAAHVGAARQSDDVILAPTLRRWSAAGFGAALEARLPAARRSLGWRLTPPQGAARRGADARSTADIAKALARGLDPDLLDVTVAQSLLPYLWREGALGGRSFRVLMTRLPMGALQARLDAAARRHPDRPTLADYRAPAWLAEAEAEALAAAAEIVTPHAEIAGLFADKAAALAWQRPSPPAAGPAPGRVFVFPGPTVARKGAFEVRDAARALGVQLRPAGSELEGPGFWEGVSLAPAAPGASWLDGACAVVHPALTEGAPRRLLEALAAGVPVIATEACGLAPQPSLTLVPMDDAEALTSAMKALLAERP